MRRESLALATCALLLLGGTSHAYYHFTHYPFRGQATPVVEKFDLSTLIAKTVYFYVSDKGPDVFAPNDSLPALISELRLAAKYWNDVPTSDLRVAYGGFIKAGTVGSTPSIQVVFDEVPPGLVALGGPTLRADQNSSGAAPFIPILQSTLILRKDLSSQQSYQESFFLSLVHEFGHTLGLQHTLTSSVMSTEVTRATTKGRPLGLDDIAGLSLLYPSASFATSTGSISGRVTAPDGAVMLASVVAYTPTGLGVSAFTGPDGSYRIDGLPPGQYSLFVHALPPPLTAETTPAGLRLPTDADGKPISPSAAFDMQFYPSGRDWSQAVTIPVVAAKVVSGIDFAVQRRGKQSIYSVQAYGFPNGASSAVKPPIVSLDSSAHPFVVLSGYGLLTSGNAPVSGLQAGAIGDSSLVADIQKYYFPGYLQLDLNLSPSLAEGPRHVLFQTANEAYVLMNAFWLSAHQPPSISSVSGGLDSKGNKSLTISGSNFTATTKFLLDGQLLDAAPIDSSLGQFQAVLPPAPAGFRSVVSALNGDGQSSMQLESDNPPSYTFDQPSSLSNVLSSATSLSPASLPPGVESVIDISAPGANLIDGMATVGFNTPDVVVRRTVIASPSHAYAVVVTAPSATGNPLMTVSNGLQSFPSSAQLTIATAGAKPFVFSPLLTNNSIQQAGVYSGASVTATLTSQPYPLSNGSAISVTIGGQTVSATASGDSQVVFTVPSGLDATVIMKAQVGQDQSLPVLVAIVPPPAFIVNIVGPNGLPLSGQRPAHLGDAVTLWVTGVTDAQLSSKFVISLSGVDQPATQVQSIGPGLIAVTFTVSPQVQTGALQGVVRIDSQSTFPFTLTVR